MEVYAGYQENADWNVGRLLDAVEEMGELDNTLVIYIFGDNGASMEGTITGSFNELTMQNGIALTPEQQLSLIEQYGGLDAWGTDAFAPHYAAAWAWAGQRAVPVGQAGRLAPGRHAQRHGRLLAASGSGTPAGCASQFTHCIDIGPTILEAAGIPEPKVVDGIAAEADGGDELPLQLRRRERGRAAHRAVLRDLRQPGDLQGRLVGRLHARPHPLGRVAADDREVRARHLRPGAGHAGSSTTCPTTSPRRTTSPRSTRRSSPSSRSSSGRRPRSTTCCRCWPGSRSSSGSCRRCRRSRRRRSTATSQNIASGMIPRVYGRSYAIEAELSVPERGRRGRDRRRGGRDGRLLALGRRRAGCCTTATR